MNKLITILIAIIAILPTASQAQDIRKIKNTADSIITTFDQQLKSANYQTTQLVNTDDYIMDDAHELTGDTIWLQNYENFKFYRIQKNGKLSRAEFFNGKIGSIFECEKISYYFYENTLLLTHYTFTRHGDEMEEIGAYYTIEDRKIIFDKNNEFPLMIYREIEGNIDEIKNGEYPYKQLDTKKIIYDKYIYETLAYKIHDNETDI